MSKVCPKCKGPLEVAHEWLPPEGIDPRMVKLYCPEGHHEEYQVQRYPQAQRRLERAIIPERSWRLGGFTRHKKSRYHPGMEVLGENSY